ncbi:MAG: PKD domain-containing protein [Patulibacter sp.]
MLPTPSARRRPARWRRAALAAVLVGVAAPHAALAHAGTPHVLALGPTLSGGANSYEVQRAEELGYEVDVVDDAGWRAKTRADFAQYRAIIIGDTGYTPASAYDAAVDTVGVWGPAVSGNVVVIGTDPVDHYSYGGKDVINNGIAYATDDASATGAFITLSDTYDGASAQTAVPLLDAFGAFTVRGVSCYESSHIVVEHPALAALTDAQLSNWGCSVHEAFDSYPQDFVPLAIALDNGSDYTAPDGTQGTPYILARGKTTSLIGRNIVALGDSVSAGEGIGYGWEWNGKDKWERPLDSDGLPIDPFWLVNEQPEVCHQSLLAHPRLLAAALNAKVTALACTGSTAYNGVLDNRTNADWKDAFGDPIVPERQLGSDTIARAAGPNPKYDDAKADVVTLSLGANDVDFEGEVKSCYGTWANCGSKDDAAEVDRKIEESITKESANSNNTSNLRKVLDEIVARGEAAGKVPLVALTEYIDPFPASYPSKSKCIDVNPSNFLGTNLSSSEFDYLRQSLRKLNKALEEVGADYENVVVVPAPTIDDHRFCSADPWVFGPSIAYTDWGKDQDNAAPFHPTVDGQQAIADNLVPYVRDRYSVRAGNGSVIQFPNSGPRLTFSNVTTPGSVAIVNVPASSLPPQTTFNPQQTFTITSSAVTTGSTTIDLAATQQQQLYHYTGGSWQQVPTTYAGGRLQGTVSSFSPFALGEPAPKVAAALSVPATLNSTVTATLDAGGSSVASPGTIKAYDWEFDDGSTATTTTATTTHRWANAGTYAVKVTVRSDAGSRDTATQTVAVTNAAPTVAIGGVAAAPGVAATLTAAAADPEGGDVAVSWDFGDGSDSAGGTRVTHTWANAGSYTVTASATDDQGQLVTDTRVVEVTPEPTPTSTPVVTEEGAEATPTPTTTPEPLTTQTPLADITPLGVTFGAKGIKRSGPRGLKLACVATASSVGKRCRVTVTAGSKAGGKQLANAKTTFTAKQPTSRTVTVTLKPAAWKIARSKRKLRVQITLLDAKGTKLATNSRVYTVPKH